MLRSRLTLLPAALAATLVLGACGEGSRPIEQLERTGVTAINEAEANTCALEASTLRNALEIYETLNGEPAPDEAALIGNGIRDESELWDIRDGRLVPQDPACGDVPPTLPTAEIVTESSPNDDLNEFADQLSTMTADDVLADASEAEIAEVGGLDCAREVAEVGLAFARWSTDQGIEPTSLRQIVDDGYLGPLELWTVASHSLEAVPGTPCIGPFEMLPNFDDACRVEARTLAVARDAYLARTPDAPEPTPQDLVDSGLLRDVGDRVDLVDGVPTALAGGVCDGVDLRESAAPSSSGGVTDCTVDYRTLGVAIEAYFIQFGRLPDNEQELVDGEMLRAAFESYDVVYGEIVPGDGSSCTVPPG